MKVEQISGFQPVTITIESRGELAIVMASLGKTCFNSRKHFIEVYGEKLDEKYQDTGYHMFEKLEQLFEATKPQTS